MTAKQLNVVAIVPTILGYRKEAGKESRAHEVYDCVRSILANSYEDLSVLVIDQSKTDDVRLALAPLLADRRLKYLWTEKPGKSHALNFAIRSADADVYLLTDDDCVVPPDWVERTVAVFARHPNAAVVFGDARLPDGHSWDRTYTPFVSFGRERLLTPSFLPRIDNLMGANMAISRPAIGRVGLFDERIGPGARLGGLHEEVDYHLRCLRAKPPLEVYVTPATYVTHQYGGRPIGAPARQLLRTYRAGQSTLLTKHALGGDLGAACRLVLLGFEPFVGAAANLVRSGRPRGIGVIPAYYRGLVRGFRIFALQRAERTHSEARRRSSPPGLTRTGSSDACAGRSCNEAETQRGMQMHADEPHSLE
jgi:GT2 family glycosyltransferase